MQERTRAQQGNNTSYRKSPGKNEKGEIPDRERCQEKTWVVEFDEETIRFLEKLEKVNEERIFKKIISAKKDPFRYFERLKGRTDYKLRIGDYRAIADIDDKIRVRVIGHRKNIYKS